MITFSERWQILTGGATPHSDGSLVAAADLGGPWAVEVETGIFLYGLVRRLQPRVIVETGTHRGFSTAWLAMGLLDNFHAHALLPPGMLTTIDQDPWEWAPERLWERLELQGVISRVLGDSTQTAPLLPGPIDLLCLDADHATEAVLAEWQALAPRLNRTRAIVTFHDTALDPRERESVRRIREEQRAPLPEYASVSHFPLRGFRGLDLLFLSNESL